MTDRPDLVELDLGPIPSKAALHDALASALRFPDWWGRNWDAFWDCITDPDLSRMPRRLTFHHSEDLARRLPGDAAILQKQLEDLNMEYPDQACLVTWA